MISKIYAWLPTRSNRQLERYAKRFRDFNLRMVAAADAVSPPFRGHAHVTDIPSLPSAGKH